MKSILAWVLMLCLLTLSSLTHSHGTATYIGNSAVLVEHNEHKVVFDPFFHNNFGIYQLVPEEIHRAMMAGTAPYNDIDAIFISHAHEDHFDVHDVIKYLSIHNNTQLFAPGQAIKQIKQYTQEPDIVARLNDVTLDFGDAPILLSDNQINVDAVRIPHAGWPKRKEVENLIFRVTLGDDLTAMHMGDADPNDDHYLPLKDHWQARETDINFPPYWFFLSAEGNDILNEILNANRHVGVHVPVSVPDYLKRSGKSYFHQPGTVLELR